MKQQGHGRQLHVARSRRVVWCRTTGRASPKILACCLGLACRLLPWADLIRLRGYAPGVVLLRAELMLRRIACRWTLSLLVAVAVSSVWRSAWHIIDGFLLPQRPLASALASLGLGSALYLAMSAVQPALASWARARPSLLRSIWALDTLYSYAGLWVCVLVWRGAWALWDEAFGYGLPPSDLAGAQRVISACASQGVGLALLLCTGTTRSLNAAPTLLAFDTNPVFGAVVSGDQYLAAGRWCQGPPKLLTRAEWIAAVGLAPQSPDIIGVATATAGGAPMESWPRGEGDGEAEGAARQCSPHPAAVVQLAAREVGNEVA